MPYWPEVQPGYLIKILAEMGRGNTIKERWGCVNSKGGGGGGEGGGGGDTCLIL